MTIRRMAGYALVALGFLFILLLGYGVIEPFGSMADAHDLGGVMGAVAPSLLIPLTMFLLGLWLARGGRRR